MNRVDMNHEMLCTWLGLPKTVWPPDAWTLLGLARGVHDLPIIEQRVHDRMAKLRCYQLSFPEEATEGMNRLAEAFVTLTETNGKPQVVEPVQAAAPAATKKKSADPRDETFISTKVKTKVEWRDAPPPVRAEAMEVPEIVEEPETAAEKVLVSQPFVAPAKPLRREIDWALVRELAEDSDEATSNLGTLEAVILRVEMTRQLLTTWDKLGKHLHAATKKISPRESEQFAKRLEQIGEVMQEYPAFLGLPGRPGYRVRVLARLKIPLLITRAMTEEQRTDLLFDWQVGRQVLLAHRKFLRSLFRSMRHRSAVGLAMHFIRSALNDYPRLTLVGILILLAAIVAVVVKLN